MLVNHKLVGWIAMLVYQEIPGINIKIIILPVNRKLLS